jgi:hypothetical protein
VPGTNEADTHWAVRIRRIGPQESRAYARSQSFSVGAQASLRDSDPHPSAIEYLLGALGGDLIAGFQAEASRRSVTVHELEIALTGRIENPLVALGVVGEEGRPGLSSVAGSLYVSADADGALLEELWHAVRGRSPLFDTLSRCARLAIDLRPAHGTEDHEP